MSMQYDIVIIGSGIGGLSAGATLAKAGKKVLVLEQHSLIGGCATCFQRKGMLVDAGLHEMDFGPEGMDIKHIFFKEVGLDKKVELINLPSAWTIVESNNMDNPITIPHGNTQEALIAAFPHEEQGIKEYFKKIKFQTSLVKRFPFNMKFLEFFVAPLTTLIFFGYNMIANRTVGEVLNGCIKDSKLKRILNINISYYHHNPFKFIFSFHAIPQFGYYNRGVYVKGGSQKFSDSLSEIITENGGKVMANSDVVSIITEDKVAKGVKYIDKKTKEEVEVLGSKIIANCDPAIVYNKLLSHIDSKELSADTELTKNMPITTSLSSIYMIFDKNLSELYPNMDYANFLVESEYFDKDFDESNTDVANIPEEKRDFAFVNYSKIDSGLSDREDRFLGVGAFYSTYEEWDLPKEEYKEKKKRVMQSYIDRLEKVYPGIMEHCIHYELATPKTIERYIRTRKGAIYGYDQDQEGFIGRERFYSKSVKNIYFASAFGFPGGGFTGAILSGYRTAYKILDPNFYARRLTLCFAFGTAVSMGTIELIKWIFG